MLKSTFLHLQGVGKKTERILWNKGITTWEKYLSSQTRQPSLFEEIPEKISVLSDSIKAYADGDMAYFAKSLPTSDYYRALLEFPEEVLFLDIETTGLSVYYDIITVVGWSVGKEFGVYINGGDDTTLRQALANAKAIVTFNGIMFDLKFINKHFDNPKIPDIHLDLRFFSKRVGLSGGQKSIEQELGFSRKSDIEGMLGEAAPILWHKYRRGDQDAMKRLIEYNHADIEGMKFILDKAILLNFKKEKYPKTIRIQPPFRKLKSRAKIAKRKPKSENSTAIIIPPFTGSNKPLVTYKELNDINPLDNFCTVGIDLVSSEDRETGFCVLRGNVATTCRVKTDDEMIRLAIEAGVDLISIDSPLSIPKGRTSFFDDDPHRDEFGITRECERILKRRGISSYPCLIPSMQKLTQRGMLLAEKFRKVGIPVIESYPGAAQDIMSIPRKQAGLDYLVEGLKEFGLTGDFTHTAVSHDELDAITSAIVGHFFWVGMYEGLGNPDEEYLIIPDLNADFKTWISRKIVGLSGQIASGKTTVSQYLKENGYAYGRYSQVLEDLLKKDGIEPTRSNLQKIGLEINEDKGQRWLGKKVCELLSNHKCGVIDGLRFLEDHALLVETYGPAFLHLHITSSLSERQKRVISRHKEDITLDSAKTNPVEREIKKLENVADHTISNDGTLEELHNHQLIQNILRKKCL
ncbi:ribonuclease H-like domain-containing protein [Desulfosediminicola sp.]|uniref:ribonuclease H-like domain-containing protein n=1 Tax=Desulfosediminicola sp. TaxID=2886825 RepID=UPI003AF209DE